MAHDIDTFEKYARARLNVLIVGTHGIGKTELALQVAKRCDLKLCYLSASTLDPYVDFVGVPVPDREANELKFYRPLRVEEAEMLVIDEFNRAHPKVQNGLMEILQFKSINGTPLPNLQFSWACINPPGQGYQVEEIDPAIQDRFHIFERLDAEPDAKILSKKMSMATATGLCDWWNTDLSKEMRTQITPRRLEYIGMIYEKGLEIKAACPPGQTYPISELKQRIGGNFGQFTVTFVSKHGNKQGQQGIIKLEEQDIYHYHEEFRTQVIPANPDVWPKMIKVILDTNWRTGSLFLIKDLLETAPVDLLVQYFNKRHARVVKQFKQMLIDYCGTMDKFQTQYPALYRGLYTL